MSTPFIFVHTGVPRLFHVVQSLKADVCCAVIKVAGGARPLYFNIGERNLLGRHGRTLHAQDVGETPSHTLRLELATDKTSIKSFEIDSNFL